ncbi:alanine racemase [Salmonella bongori]|nr:alanine racemase [Salmonella bongori]
MSARIRYQTRRRHCGIPEAHYDWVRPGIILYGASPSGLWRDIANTGLKPVMTLSSEIIGVQTLKAGEKVGYGGCYTAGQEAAHWYRSGRLC